MKTKLDEKKCASLIDEIKGNLHLNVVTEGSKIDYRDKLLDSIDSCSDEKSNNIFTIEEINKIVNDDKLFWWLNDEQKARLYWSLWDNFYSLWDIEKTYKYFNKSLLLWNKDISTIFIVIKIFNDFIDDVPLHYESPKIVDFLKYIDDLSDDIKELKSVKSDIIEIFFWEAIYIEKPESINDNIYNVELFWKSRISELQLNADNLNEKDLLIEFNKSKEIINEKYKELIDKFTDESDIIMIQYSWQNYKLRLSWQTTRYLEYWKFKDLFIESGFEIIETYFNNWEYDKSMNYLSFLVHLWYTKLTNQQAALVWDIYYDKWDYSVAYREYYINILNIKLRKEKISKLVEGLIFIEFDSENMDKKYMKLFEWKNVFLWGILYKLNNDEDLNREEYEQIAIYCAITKLP